MPALPLDDAGPYVAGAYLVFLGLILAYVSIMAGKLARIAREIDSLSRLPAPGGDGEPGAPAVREPTTADAEVRA